MFALVLGLFTAVAASPEREAWAQFKRDFGKTYASEAEEAERYAVFTANLEAIERLNTDHAHAEFQLNAFADLSADEFAEAYLTGFRPSLQQLWGSSAHLGTHEYSGAALPEHVDWVTHGAVAEVKNQASCGSCWSFSATGALEGAWQIATGHLVPISEQQLVDCSKSFGNMGCNGGLMDNAFQYMEQNAMCSESEYAYVAEGSTCNKKKLQKCNAVPKGAVKGFKDVDADDEKALREAVSQGPVSIAIEADKNAFQFYRSGVLRATCGQQLDHGVLLVGYGTDAEAGDYWKVKNSWGPKWGDAGYIRLSRAKTDGPAGECGLMKQPSYPVVKAPEQIFV
jgi:C1A family cysteine protease